MSIRIPSSPVLDYTSTIATATTDSATVLLPQDCDSVTVKVWAPTFGATSDDIYIQTSPDGGTTWYDMGNMGQITAAVVEQNALFGFFSTLGQPRTNAASVSAGGAQAGIGACAASTATAKTYTGLPIMGRNFRVYFKMAGSGASSVRVQVFANQQSATA